ncbi:MAG: ribonuclease III [Dysosmobacter welbionis]
MENYFEPNLTDDQLRAISSIGLAHMGDAVFEVLVRTWLCAHGKATEGAAPGHHCPGAGGEPGGEGGADPAPFDGRGSRCVPPRAERSREVGTGHATRAQYGEATALEALLGWLYLKGRRDRINALFRAMMEE